MGLQYLNRLVGDGAATKLADNDASPSIGDKKLVIAPDVPPAKITAFDDVKNGHEWIIQPGAADLIIGYVAGLIETPNRVDYPLRTAAGGGVSIDLYKENGVVRFRGAAGAARFTDAGAVADNAVIALAAGQRKTLLARSYTGVQGLADGEFAALIPPATGDVTFTHAGSPATGQAFDLDQDTNVVIPGGSSSAIIIQRVGSTIRIASGVGARLDTLLDGASVTTRDDLRSVVFGDVIGGAPNFAIIDDPLAVNYLAVSGTIAGFRPVLTAAGSDANIAINIVAKGAPSVAAAIQDGSGPLCLFANDGSTEQQFNPITIVGAKLSGDPKITSPRGMAINAASGQTVQITIANKRHLQVVGSAGTSYILVSGDGGATALLAASNTAGPDASLFMQSNGLGLIALANSGVTIAQFAAPGANYFRFWGSSTGNPITIRSDGDADGEIEITNTLGRLALFASDQSGGAQANYLTIRSSAASVPAIVANGQNSVEIANADGAIARFTSQAASATGRLNVTAASDANPFVNIAASSPTLADTNFYFTVKGAGGYVFATTAAKTLFGIVGVASAVNGLRLTPGAAGSPIILSAQGDDANVDFIIRKKGAGAGRLQTVGGADRIVWNSTGVGFFGATPVAQAATVAAATDAASTQTLANALRTMAINVGLMAAT